MTKRGPEFGETLPDSSLPPPVEGRERWNNWKQFGKAAAGTAAAEMAGGLYVGRKILKGVKLL